MQYGQRAERNVIGYTDRGYSERRHSTGKHGRKKFSGTMALILGGVLTLELMIMGAMIFHIDFYSTDRIALVLSFVVLYFGIVAGLTDK